MAADGSPLTRRTFTPKHAARAHVREPVLAPRGRGGHHGAHFSNADRKTTHDLHFFQSTEGLGRCHRGSGFDLRRDHSRLAGRRPGCRGRLEPRSGRAGTRVGAAVYPGQSRDHRRGHRASARQTARRRRAGPARGHSGSRRCPELRPGQPGARQSGWRRDTCGVLRLPVRLLQGRLSGRDADHGG